MTTSGTASFNLDLTDIVEEAFERAGSEVRSGYDLRTARRSMNLLFADWANRGINLWTVEQGQITLEPGVNTYDLPLDTVDLIEHVIRTNADSTTNQSDLTITRISVSTYSSIPNKLSPGRPIQIWVNRQSGAKYPTATAPSYANDTTGVDAPQVTVWPTPDNSQVYTLVYWRLRRIQDADGGTNTFDVPFRMVPCLAAGLAYYIAMKIPNGMDRLQVLKQQYDEAWEAAATEDREKAAVRFVPRRMFIT